MFGGKKTFSSIEVVNTVIKSGQYAGRSGAVVISRKNGRKTVNTGILYVNKNNLIYAAEVENTRLSMGTRVKTSGEISAENFEEMNRKFGGNLNHPGILPFLLENQMIDDEHALQFVKEYFLAYVEDILSWDNVVGTWQNDKVYEHSTIDIKLSLDDLQTILRKRKKTYYDFFELTNRFFSPHHLPELIFMTKKTLPAGVSGEAQLLHNMARRGVTIPAAAEATGLSNHSVFKSMLGFWRIGVAEIHLGDKVITYEYAMRMQNLGIGEAEPEVEVIVEDDEPKENIELPASISGDQLGDELSATDEGLSGDSIEEKIEDQADVSIEKGAPVATPDADEADVEEVPEETPAVESAPEGFDDDTDLDPESESEEDEEFVPRESPVYQIHQKLEELTLEHEEAIRILGDITAERSEQEQGVALIEDRMQKIAQQLHSERKTLKELVAYETKQRDVVERVEKQIEETISSFQYGQH